MAFGGDTRFLKLGLLADTSKFTTGLNNATKQTKTFGQKVGDTAKRIGKAFALAGVAVAGMAAKLAIDGVKAAIADEKAQVKLATTLRNTTKASNGQIKSVEKYIDKLQRASGVADDKLRPSLEKLLVATGKVGKAQKLQALAMDIAAGTGKDLDTVSLSLAKAYGGNLGSLTRLGVVLDESIIKNKDFKAAQEELNKLFGGQSAAAAETMEGKFKRFNIAISEAQESIGVALMPTIEKMVDFLNSPKGQKVVTDFAEAFAEAIKMIAKYLPGVVRQMSGLVKGVSKSGIAGLFSDERLVAAGLAYGAGLMYGGPAAGALAAMAAYYGADQLIGQANKFDSKTMAGANANRNVAGLQMTNGGLGLVTDPSGRLAGGLTGNLVAGQGLTGAKNLTKIKAPVNITVVVNGAADSRESARAIERTLNKLNLNGGSSAGILGFN